MGNEEIRLGKYRHFKGNEYEVIGVARHSETLEKLVIYKSLYESERYPKGTLWARPLSLFLSKKRIDDKEVPRFEYLGDE